MSGQGLLYGNITEKIIGAAMEVHRNSGPGFLESVYEEAMACELSLLNIPYERQKSLPVYYKGTMIKGFTCDLIVESMVLVELKAIKQITEVEIAQVISCLKAGQLKVGLLINFAEPSLVYKRLVKSNP
jgi:GxxExxY protein